MPNQKKTKKTSKSKKQLQEASAVQRSARPLEVQKASAEAHLKRVSKVHENVVSQLALLQKQHDDLAQKLAEKQAAKVVHREEKLNAKERDAMSILKYNINH